MVKLYGHPLSTCTRKVLMTLGELNQPFELTTVDFASGEHKKEPHISRQPFGRLPAIEDDGFKMYESRAICRYLNERFGGKLIPSDLQARAKMEQYISVETSEFTGAAMKFVFEHVFKRPQAAGVLDEAAKTLETTCGVLEKQLATTPFLVGESFTLADVMFMPYIEYAIGTPAKEVLARHKNFMTWWNKIRERPTWQKVAGGAHA